MGLGNAKTTVQQLEALYEHLSKQFANSKILLNL